MSMVRKSLVLASFASAALMLVSMFAHWYVAVAVFATLPVAFWEVRKWTLGKGPALLVRWIVGDLICSTGRHPFVVLVRQDGVPRFYCLGCGRALARRDAGSSAVSKKSVLVQVQERGIDGR